MDDPSSRRAVLARAAELRAKGALPPPRATVPSRLSNHDRLARAGSNPDKVDEMLKCPLSLVIFDEPVIAADSNTYEKELICQWIASSKGPPISPVTGLPLAHTHVMVNNSIRIMVTEFVDKECMAHERTLCGGPVAGDGSGGGGDDGDDDVRIVALSSQRERDRRGKASAIDLDDDGDAVTSRCASWGRSTAAATAAAAGKAATVAATAAAVKTATTAATAAATAAAVIVMATTAAL